MKILLITLAFFIGGLGQGNPVVTTKEIDINKSQAMWKGYKVLGSHEGNVNFKSGTLEFDEERNLVGGELVIDMSSLSTTDLKGDSATKLVGHLKSPDFFGTEEFPEASFVISKVVSRGKIGDYKIKGDLTIKGITKEISFNAMIVDQVATATLSLDRSDYNVKYGSGSFFKNLGDNTIYDEFDLTVNIVF